jgi:hypothetical protein
MIIYKSISNVSIGMVLGIWIYRWHCPIWIISSKTLCSMPSAGGASCSLFTLAKLCSTPAAIITVKAVSIFNHRPYASTGNSIWVLKSMAVGVIHYHLSKYIIVILLM